MADHTFTAEPGSLKLVTTYVFDAPREHVFEVYTNPDLVPKWWGVEGAELRVEKMEVRPGGSWRYIMSGDGKEFGFRGVYHGVTAPEQIMATWQFEGAPTVMFQTMTFEELPNGQTKVTDESVFRTLEDRQAMLTTGMEEGSVPMMDRLAKML